MAEEKRVCKLNHLMKRAQSKLVWPAERENPEL